MKIPTLRSFVWVAVSTCWLPVPAFAQEREELEPRREPVERHLPDVIRYRDDSDGPPQGHPKLSPEETRREVERLRSQLVEFLNDGKDEEAAELKQRIAELERQQMRPGRMEGPDRFRGGGPDQGEMQRRLNHVEIAIDHLHRAGLHEPAEHLARQAERMRAQLAGNMGPDRGEPYRDGGSRELGPRERREERRVIIREENHGLEGEVNELRNEVRELRQAMREIQEHLKQAPK